MSSAPKIITLNGVITMTESDRKNKPLEIAIETDDFQTYVITCKNKGKELFNYISEKATLQCELEGKNYYGHPIITILEYSIQKNKS
jgi:hypothetical protein